MNLTRPVIFLLLFLQLTAAAHSQFWESRVLIFLDGPRLNVRAFLSLERLVLEFDQPLEKEGYYS